MSTRVITNHKARELMMWLELPDEVAEEFDYLDEDEKFVPRFVLYRGEWYDVSDVQVVNGGTIADFPVGKDHPLYGWNGVQTDSAFSGVVFRWLKDHEAYERDLDSQTHIIVGRYEG